MTAPLLWWLHGYDQGGAPVPGGGTGGGVAMAVEVWRATVDNVPVEDLSDDFVDGRIELNLDRAIRLTASLTMRHPEKVTPYADFLAVFLALVHDDATPDERFQLGLFATRVPPGQRTHVDALATFALEDLTSVVAGSAYADTNNVSAGIGIRTNLVSTIAAAGVARTNFPANPETLPASLSWPVGTTRLEKANHLTDLLGWYDPWMDLDGRIASREIRDLAQVEPYQTIRDDDLLAPIDVQPLDTSLANVVIVVDENPSQAALTATRRNDDPGSPTSTVALGREIVRVERRSDLGSQAAADALADRLLSEGRSYYQTATVVTGPHAGIGVHQTVDLALTGPWASLNGRWWVRTWSLGLRPASAVLTHEVNRVTDDLTGAVV